MKTNIILIILAISLVFNYFLFRGVNKLSDKNDIMEANQRALTAKIEKRVEGKDTVYSKEIFQVENLKDLKKLDRELYNELKNLDGKVQTFNRLLAEIDNKIGNIPTNHSVSDSTITLTWGNESQFRTLKGQNVIGYHVNNNKFFIKDVKTDITEDIYRLELTSGTRKRNGKIEYYVEPKDPNMKIVDIKGGTLVEPIKKFGIGLQLGVGINQQLNYSPYIGIGLNYNLVRF